DRHAGLLEAVGELQRRLAAELDDHALGTLDLDDPEHVLERQRLEVQPVGGVVVGGDRLGVAVDHHRVATGLADGHRGVDAAVVELDALPDAVGAAPEGAARLEGASPGSAVSGSSASAHSSSRNQGSIAVRSRTSATLAPLRKASST